MLELALADPEAVGEADNVVDSLRDPLDPSRERSEVGDVEAPGVDPADAADRHRDPGDGANDRRVELLALLGRALLRVVELAERPPVAHRRRS